MSAADVDLGLLLQRQEEREEHALQKGKERFWRRVKDSKTPSQVGAARKLLVLCIEKLQAAIEQQIEEAKTKKGRPNQMLKWAEMVGPDVCAYMTVKVVLDGMGVTKANTLRMTALCITDLMEDELRYRRFRERAKGLFEYTMSRFNTSSYAHMARSLSVSMNRAVCDECRKKDPNLRSCRHLDMSDLTMLPATKLYVGTALLNLLIETTGIVEYQTYVTRVGRKVHTESLIVPTQGALEWLDLRNAALEFLWPINVPMVVPPLPWGPGERGGYRFAMRNKHPLVRGTSPSHLQTLSNRAMPDVYAALNRIQETAWRINPSVLDLVQQIAERGGGMAGIPETNPEPEPRRPPEIDEFNAILKERKSKLRMDLPVEPLADEVAAYDAEWKAWRKAAHGVKERNHIRKIKAKEFLNTLSTALSVKDEAAIYFPCSLDFRGRVYPLTNYLTPQGDDLSKSLLYFSDAKPVGAEGATYLAIHGANCLGETPDGLKLSKATLQERVDWIVSHTPQIEAVVRDPFAHGWWCEESVDDPLQFYAFCVEWAAYVAEARAGRGELYVSGLPVAMDGTCNGLQHFAAMLRDAVGAEAVNVLPMDRPQDIYQRNADAVLDDLEATPDNPLSQLWLKSGLVTRKLTKRPTMTFGYGSKRFGFKEQLVQYLQGREDWPEIKKLFTKEKLGDLVSPACSLMSGLIWDALWETCKAASEAMEWLQQAARGVVKAGKCVEWTVPKTGFRVRQEYMKLKTTQITTILAGRTVRPGVYTSTQDPDPVRQVNAIAPNFVHSLDAAALMLTVNSAAAGGVEAFGMVHDSYATVAGDAELLAGCTRQAFYSLYAECDVLADLAEQLKGQWQKPEKFPELPAKGTLDLGGVLVSPYFFS